MKPIHIFIFVLFSISVNAQTNLFPHAKQKWVDSVFATLSIDQKIGQVLMPRGNSSPVYDTTRLFSIVRDYHVGGFVLFAGFPTVQAQLVNELQKTIQSAFVYWNGFGMGP